MQLLAQQLPQLQQIVFPEDDAFAPLGVLPRWGPLDGLAAFRDLGYGLYVPRVKVFEPSTTVKDTAKEVLLRRGQPADFFLGWQQEEKWRRLWQ